MFAQTADALLAHFRAEVSDTAMPPLWEDWEIYGYMTEGFDALLKGQNGLHKELVLQGAAGQFVLPLPASVTHIHAAFFSSATSPNREVSLGQDSVTFGVPGIVQDYGQPRVFSSATVPPHGTPCRYTRDADRRALRLSAVPQEAYTVRVVCSATLSIPMQPGMPLPSTDAEDLRLVLHYMKHLAYRKHDAETEDLVRARDNEMAFHRGVVERESRLRNYRRPAGVVRMEVF